MQIILGVVFLFLLILLLSKSDILTPHSRNIILAILSTIVIFAVIYEYLISKGEENNRVLINAFMQGKSLTCKGAIVTQKDYTLERGTLSFMAKDEKREIVGTIYSVEDCKLKE
jgi:hypothetical protein